VIGSNEDPIYDMEGYLRMFPLQQSYDVTTNFIFVLNLSLFWFMMKHRGKYCEILLGWFHWLFDYS
jgi:hypothetical protein